MTFIFILFLIGVFFTFAYFNTKLRNLEKEIFDLKKKIQSPGKIAERSVQDNGPFLDKGRKTFVLHQTETSTKKQERDTTFPKTENWSEGVFDFVKQNILTIIGILTLVLGIGYFVKYAIDKNWIGETLRFLIGIFVGLGILVIGYFLKKNNKIFSAILSGGGLAVLYLSVTISFQQYHLFSQNVGFTFLLLITILAVGISYFYDSEVLIIFALIGGFASPLMISTGHSNYLFLFSYLSLLNLGMLAIAYLKNWKSIGWVTFFATYLYLGFWMMDKIIISSIYFFVLFYLIFYAFALHNYFKRSSLDSQDLLLLVLINFISITGITYIFINLNLQPLAVIPLLFAVINILLWLFEKRKNRNNLYHPIFVGLSLSLITVAIALQFKMHLITTIWAVESVLILFLWKKTKDKIFRKSFTILILLILVAEVFTWFRYADAENLDQVLNPVFLTGILVSICFAFNYFQLKKYVEPKEIWFLEADYFKFLVLGNVFLVGLLEILNQLQNNAQSFITVTSILYALYFIFILLLLHQFFLKRSEEKVLIYISLVLSILTILIPDFAEVLSKKEISYGYYLLYLFPFIFAVYRLIKNRSFESKIDFRFVALTIVFIISMEFSHLYLWNNLDNIQNTSEIQKYFVIFFLPFIWTIMAVSYLFLGLKKNLPELTKIGFFLILLMALKLYTYDVWKMDNISRIIAFIILGLILLTSSFTFQKIKGIIKNLK